MGTMLKFRVSPGRGAFRSSAAESRGELALSPTEAVACSHGQLFIFADFLEQSQPHLGTASG